MNNTLKKITCDVAIIGAGPAGLSAATTLKKEGIQKVIVIERETEGGGIPRHCGHPPFGILEYRRVLTGPLYARRNVKTALDSGVELMLKTSVLSLGKSGRLSLLSTDGPIELTAKRVIIATGTRETPRSARKVSGNRPLGICNTGALQAMVYLKNRIPFKHPIIVGSEIVSFSAVFTCIKAGIKPVAMVEQRAKANVMWPIKYVLKFVNIPLLLGCKVEKISGKDRVEKVSITCDNGEVQEIKCDGVLFTGEFVPESNLLRMSHLQIDSKTGLPKVDKSGQCSDPSYYVAGNILFSPVKVAGKCWKSGEMVAKSIIKDLADQ